MNLCNFTQHWFRSDGHGMPPHRQCFAVGCNIMRPILSTVLLFAFFSSFGQNTLKGKWYTFSFDMLKVVEFNFDSPTFVSNKLDWELKNQPGMETARITKTIQSRQNLYYFLEGLVDTGVVTLLILSSLKPDSSFVLATTSEKHAHFKSPADALSFIEVDTLIRPGLIFYSQKEFERLKTLPDASTITKENYRKYLQGLIDEKIVFEKFATKHKGEFAVMFFKVYLPNQARKVLANLGYNPAIDDQRLEQVNEKFKD